MLEISILGKCNTADTQTLAVGWAAFSHEVEEGVRFRCRRPGADLRHWRTKRAGTFTYSLHTTHRIRSNPRSNPPDPGAIVSQSEVLDYTKGMAGVSWDDQLTVVNTVESFDPREGVWRSEPRSAARSPCAMHRAGSVQDMNWVLLVLSACFPRNKRSMRHARRIWRKVAAGGMAQAG